MELDALSQLECPGQIVVAAIPAFDQQGSDSVVARVLEKSFENGVGNVSGARCGRPKRVERLDAARRHYAKGTAELRFVSRHHHRGALCLRLRHGRELRRLRRRQRLYHCGRRGCSRGWRCGSGRHSRRLCWRCWRDRSRCRRLLCGRLLYWRGAGACYCPDCHY